MLRYGIGTAENPWGPYAEAATVLVAGDTASGKSTDAARAFGGLGLYALSVSGGMKPAAGVWGLELARNARVENLHQVQKRVDTLLSKPAAERVGPDGTPIRAILLDNVSQPASASHTLHEQAEERTAARRSKEEGREIGANIFAAWRRTMDLVLEVRDKCRAAGIFFACNGDLRGPSTDEQGHFHRGGISLPSRGRTADMAKMADIVAVMQARPSARPAPLFGARLLVGHDPDNYHGRDRHHVAPADGPGNVGELLRGAGYYLPRHPLMEGWAEPLVAEGAQRLAAPGNDAEAAAEAGRRVRHRLRRVRDRLVADAYAGQPALLGAHMLWVLSDTLDRAEILLAHAAAETALLAEPATPWQLTTPSGDSVDDL